MMGVPERSASARTARGFSLTPKGLELAEKVGKTRAGERPLFRAKQPDRVRADIRTRAGRFVRALEESDAYAAYRRDEESAAVSEFDFRSMLLCTMESSTSTLRNNSPDCRSEGLRTRMSAPG